MKLLATFFLLAGVASVPVAASELLILGQVESILLVARGTPSCIDPADVAPPASAPTRVMISTACGCQEITIRVKKTFFGAPPAESLVLHTPLGEFCTPTLHVSRRPTLIQVLNGSARSTELTEESNQLLFDPKPFWTILGVPAKALAVDGEGRASLTELLERTRGAH